MKRTQADIIAPPFFEMYMGGDYIHDICIGEDLVQNLLRIIHRFSTFYSTDQDLGMNNSSYFAMAKRSDMALI